MRQRKYSSTEQGAKPTTPGVVQRCSRSFRPERSGHCRLQWPKQLFSNSSLTPITHFNLAADNGGGGEGSSNSQWVSQMIHPLSSLSVALLRRRRPVRRPPLQQSGPTSPATFFPNPFIWRRYRGQSVSLSLSSPTIPKLFTHSGFRQCCTPNNS